MERETYGVVLTAGSTIKHAPNHSKPMIDEDGEFIFPWVQRIEPDREGKMRALAGLEDLRKGKITKLLIAGGARNYDIPLANIYLNYLKRFLEKYNLPEDSIVEVEGGTNTLSDLQKTKKLLAKQYTEVDLNLYSSGYHFERKSILDFAKKNKSSKIAFVLAEEKIKERHRFYGEAGRRRQLGPISERILKPEFVGKMRVRNRQVDLLNRLHATWIVQAGSYILRNWERKKLN